MQPGFFQLKTAKNLFQKLGRDLEKLGETPNDVDVAFNFFVTAEHLVDWVHPDVTKQGDNDAARRGMRQDPLLATVSHIANGAKHFKATNPKHKSVKETKAHVRRRPQITMYGPTHNPIHYPVPVVSLMIELEPAVAQQIGYSSTEIRVVDLAQSVHLYWETHPACK